MRISDWSSDVCSSDLSPPLLDRREDRLLGLERLARRHHATCPVGRRRDARDELPPVDERPNPALDTLDRDALQTEIERGLGERIERPGCFPLAKDANRRYNGKLGSGRRSEENTSEIQ